MQSGTIETAIVAAATAVLLFILQQYLLERLKTYLACRRLQRVQISEAMATIAKFNPVLNCLYDSIAVIHSHRPDGTSHIPTDSERVALLNGVTCSTVIACPTSEPKELIKHLSGESVQQIIYFYDRWERFIAFERRYFEAYQGLAKALANCEQRHLPWLLDDYETQLDSYLQGMYSTGASACYWSAMLVRKFASDGDSGAAEASNRVWLSWTEWESSRQFYNQERNRESWPVDANPWPEPVYSRFE